VKLGTTTKVLLLLVLLVVVYFFAIAPRQSFGSSVKSDVAVVDENGHPITGSVSVSSVASQFTPISIIFMPQGGTPITVDNSWIDIGRNLMIKNTVTITKNDPQNKLAIGIFKWHWDSITMDGRDIKEYFTRYQRTGPDASITLIGTETTFSIIELSGTDWHQWGTPVSLDYDGITAFLNLKAFQNMASGTTSTVVITFTISLVGGRSADFTDITSQIQPFSTTQSIVLKVTKT